MTADDMVEKYGVTTEKAAAIAAAQRYMTSEAWARLVKKLEECAGDAEAIREAIDKGGGHDASPNRQSSLSLHAPRASKACRHHQPTDATPRCH